MRARRGGWPRRFLSQRPGRGRVGVNPEKTRRAVPSRDLSGPPVDPDSLKALIVSQPKALEDGFRVLEVDLSAGRAGTIDILGLDRSGALTLLAVPSGDPDEASLRLLDHQLWVAHQRDLLRRIHIHTLLDLLRPARALLLSSTL